MFLLTLVLSLTAVSLQVDAQKSSGFHQLAPSRWDVPVPHLDVKAPAITLPKGPMEVVDIPHSNIVLPGNRIENKDLYLDLPSPIIEAPKPIVKQRDVLFKVPQPIFLVPKPIIQLKPKVYKAPYTLRTITPRVKLTRYLFKIPQAKITGKSAYTQPIPAKYHL